MKLLKVSTLAHLLARTNQGDLHLVLRLGEDKYHITLDSVELPNYGEIMDVLFLEEIPKVKK
jgi:hypothetical protein